MGQTPDTNDTASTKNTTVPFALETAAAWSWRLLVVAGAGWGSLAGAGESIPARYFAHGCGFAGGPAKPRRVCPA